jgi:GNAT superfamily N-acetyltransferase
MGPIKNGGVSLLRWLGVKRTHQKKGLGRQLITAWLKLATDQGCHKAEVAAQPEAKEFYAKVGLNLEGHRIKSYFGIDQYIFGKVLYHHPSGDV